MYRLIGLRDNVTLVRHGSGLSSNTYLIECSETSELVIIDPGLPDALSLYVRDLGSRYRRLHVIHTHMHYDHIASTQAMKEIFERNVVVYHHIAERTFLESGDSLTTLATRFKAVLKPIKVDRILIEGTLNIGGEEFKIIHTPGHTIGSVCILYRDIIFTGDTLFHDGSPGRYDLPTGDKALLRESLSKLLSLDVKIIAPGHGGAAETDFKGLVEGSLLRLGYF